MLRLRSSVERVAVVLITSDKGLCGGYNHNILRLADKFAEEAQTPLSWITVGRKGRNSTLRMGRPMIADFENISDQPALAEITPIAKLVMEDFLAGKYDEVYLMFTEFRNTMIQKPHVRPLLPLRYEALDNKLPGVGVDEPAALIEYVYEPSPSELLETVLPRFVELQVYEALLEAKASEHSARMVAMRSGHRQRRRPGGRADVDLQPGASVGDHERDARYCGRNGGPGARARVGMTNYELRMAN